MDSKKLAAIHIVKKELGLTDKEYRGILFRQAGVNSAKDLNDEKFRKLMNFFVRSKYYKLNQHGLTIRQKLYIEYLVNELDWDEKHFNNFLRKYYHKKDINKLEKKEAINLIESLKAVMEHEKTLKFVLVHGAYQGAWCWKKIIGLLRGQRALVFTPTLSGLGEKSNLLSPSINLSTHINDVAELISKENLHGLILVGHSYAGFVISGVAEIFPERIKHLIYLDAMVPKDGQRVFDIRPSIRSKAVEIETPYGKVKAMMPPLPEVFGITDPEDAAWVKPLLTPMPYACYDEPLRLRKSEVNKIKKTYLLNKIQVPGESFESHKKPYDSAIGENWSRKEIPGPHASMITHPKELAAAFLEISR